MGLIERIKEIELTFSFGKAGDYHKAFCKATKSLSMYDNGLGLGIPSTMNPGNQLRAVFYQINAQNGTFVFNISGVDIERSLNGFDSYEDAFDNNFITEWELWMILSNSDYLDRTIFHNGKTEFSKTDVGIEIEMLWNH